MEITFEDRAWAEMVHWINTDKHKVKKINELIKSIKRNGLSQGIGKPEPLKHDFTGYWSRRIDEANRLVYTIENNQLRIVSCKGHYG